MTGIQVNVDNFVRAETDRMFSSLLGEIGAVNTWQHNRRLTPVESQPMIRMNRDTSGAIVDLADGAALTIPDVGERYMSATVVNQDHYVDRILHADEDGAITIHFGGCEDGRVNCLPITDGWSYTVPLYRPRPPVLDRSWTFPTITPA